MRMENDGVLDKSPIGDPSGEPQAPACTVDAADWLLEPDEPDNPLVEGLIESGEVFAIVGQAKAGKSLLALQMAVSIAAGVQFLGKACARRKVYVANLEVSARQYKKRLRRICEGLDIDPDILRGWLFVGNAKGQSASWKMALDACTAHGCEVAFIDPFYQIAHIAETDEVQCLAAVEEMKAFTRKGITLGIVFHSPKGFSGDRQLVDMISGSSVLARFPESILGFLNHAEDKTARVFDAILRNYPPPEPFAVSTANGMLELAPDTAPEVATAKNAWRRTQKSASSETPLKPYVMKVVKESEEEAEKKGATDYKGIPSRALADKARDAYMEATGKSLGIKRMPEAVAVLVEDKKLIQTDRTGKDGRKYVGTPEKMKWWTGRGQPVGCAEGGGE